MPLLTTAHDSGFWRLARSYQIEGFHLQSSADLSRRTGWLISAVLPANTDVQWKCVKREETKPANGVEWQGGDNATINTETTQATTAGF